MRMNKADAQKRKPLQRVKGALMTVERARSRYEHGTRARYALGKCRCAKCKRANRLLVAEQVLKRTPFRTKRGSDGYWRVYHFGTNRIYHRVEHRDAARELCASMNADHNAKHPDPTRLIATEAVVRHIRNLQADGVGLKQIARSAGVAYSPLSRIIEGDIVRTRHSTAQKLLAVSVDDIAGGARVRGDETFVLLERLVSAGFSRVSIAHKLGSTTKALQIGKHTAWVMVKTARAVHALYCELQATTANLPKIGHPFKVGVTESTPVRAGRRCSAATRMEIVGTRDASRFPHGTRGRFTEFGCRCKPCVAANTAYETSLATKQPQRCVMRRKRGLYVIIDAQTNAAAFKSRSRQKALAIRDVMNTNDPIREGRVLVNPDAATAHIRALIAAGLSANDIARGARCTATQIMRIRDRVRNVRGVSRDLARRILAVDATSASGAITVDAAQTWRLLDRLTAVGFRQDWVAKTAGITITYRGTRIRADRARAIAAIYGVLRERVPLIRDLEARDKAAA